jgi:ribonuclease HI
MEALALREGLRSVLRQNLIKVQVDGDSKLIIDCVLNKCSVPWRLKMVIKDIQWLATQFQAIQFAHIFREANFTADALANLGHHPSSVGSWDRYLPVSVTPALQFDFANLGCPRGFQL